MPLLSKHEHLCQTHIFPRLKYFCNITTRNNIYSYTPSLFLVAGSYRTVPFSGRLVPCHSLKKRHKCKKGTFSFFSGIFMTFQLFMYFESIFEASGGFCLFLLLIFLLFAFFFVDFLKMNGKKIRHMGCRKNVQENLVNNFQFYFLKDKIVVRFGNA